MITQLDTESWRQELVTNNAEFVETSGQKLYIVSNIKSGGFGFNFGRQFTAGATFSILRSDAVPPAVGPGASFTVVQSYTFPQPTISFDPVVAFDASSGLLHILGTRNSPTGTLTSSPQLSDIVKFTFNMVTGQLSGPFVIVASTGSRVRNAYDIALTGSNTAVAISLTDPAIPSGTITGISASSGVATIHVTSMAQPFVPGQLVILEGITNATFLKDQVLRVGTATSTSFTADISTSGGYGEGFGFLFGDAFGSSGAVRVVPETGSANPLGNSLVAMELDSITNAPVPNSIEIIAISPPRTGSTYDGISLLSTGQTVELYWQSHPKLLTFKNQVFSINLSVRRATLGFGFGFGNAFNVAKGFGALFGAAFGAADSAWDTSAPTVLYQFQAWYSDLRLTLTRDASGTTYLSQTFFSQVNHPEGLIGNVLLGVKRPSQAWAFHVTPGTVVGGSIVQGTLSVSESLGVNFVYLLQPFDAIPPPPGMAASYPLHVGAVDTSTMSFTDAAGFYNQRKFTWLRGTKSTIDDASLWATVGEEEVLADALGEIHVVPAVFPHSVSAVKAADFWQNIDVIDTSGTTPTSITAVINNPMAGQYSVEPTGLYTFSAADAAVGIIGIDLTGHQLTVSGSNVVNLRVGMKVLFMGLTTATYLNGQTLSVTGVDVLRSTFTADFIDADDPEHPDTGLAGKPIALSYSYISAVTPVFISHFNVPPVAALTPTSATVLRAHPTLLSAAGSTDADADPLKFIWTENDPDLTNVTITPQAGGTAALSVARAVGGAARSFNVGVAVVDLQADGVTPRHDVVSLTEGFGFLFGHTFGSSGHVSVDGNGVVTVDAQTTLAVGETVMLYGIAMAAPGTPTFGANTIAEQVSITNINLSANILTVTTNNSFGTGQIVEFSGLGHFSYLNGQTVTILSATTAQFTAAYTSADDSWADTGSAFYPPTTTYYVKTTYLNPVGQSPASVEASITVPAGQLPVVQSPVPAGDATHYNVSMSTTPGTEQLQNSVPLLLGIGFGLQFGSVFGDTEFALPLIGVISGNPAPTISTAFLSLNDQVYTVTGWTPTQFTATTSQAPALLLPTAARGWVAYQYQYATCAVSVPFNAVPTITFPHPPWLSATINVARNTTYQITDPVNITDATTQFPIIITGMTEADDAPVYTWTQVAGTPVSMTGMDTATLTFTTNGVDIHGESLQFQLTVHDGVNPVVVSSICTAAVAAYNFSLLDTKKISRSNWTERDAITNIVITGNVLTVTANNTFVVGQKVTLTGLTTATFLNNRTVTVVALIGNTGFTASFNWPNYPTAADVGYATANARIAQRNTLQTWSTPDQSILYNDLGSIKRTSVTDGTDRYIVISSTSVMVYGVFGDPATAVLLRKLFTPNGTHVVDAVHTEDDYTLVIDDTNKLFRYSTAALINTDNPDAVINLPSWTPMKFNKIFATHSYAGTRVLALSGRDGCTLLEIDNNTLEILGVLQLTTLNLVAGSNNVQFVRLVGVENLHSGKVLLGTADNVQAAVTAVRVSGNALTVTCVNNFKVGDVITLSGFTGGTAFLNGRTVTALSVSGTQFVASLQATLSPTTVTAVATALNHGTTYETLIDLPHGQILGTWDATKLRNQFVNTGEILFAPESQYAGRPMPPVQGLPIAGIGSTGSSQVTIVWTQQRPDLCYAYTVEFATQTPTFFLVPNSLTYQSPTTFGQNISVVDMSAVASITNVEVFAGTLTLQCINTFQNGDQITISNLSSVPSLNGQTITIVSTTGLVIYASITHPDVPPTDDFGAATKTLNQLMTPVAASPQAGQYAVTTHGLYTFNVAQTSHNLDITFRSGFNLLQRVNSGAIQKLTTPLSSGTYAFRIQAFSTDGTSDYSNVQVITF